MGFGIRDPRVIEAFRTIDRSIFVPERHRNQVGADEPIPIPHEQVTTQPSLVAQMVEALQLTGSEKVLEVGTGLGFEAAILSRLCREVFTIERFPDLAEQAKRNFARAGITNVQVRTGDGSLGLPEQSPFQAIIIAAAAMSVPPPLIRQLAEGGRLVQPIGPGGYEEVRAYRKQEGQLGFERLITPARFVPLVGKYAGIPLA